MNRSWLIWSVLLVCAIVILGVFAWITDRSLTAEREKASAESSALLGERVRLSLSRMDVIGSDLLVAENLRAPMFYQSHFSPSNLFTNDLVNVEQGVVLQQSPLLLEDVEFIDLHFQINSQNEITSPQVPDGSLLLSAKEAGLGGERLKVMTSRLAHLREKIPDMILIRSLFNNDQTIVSWGNTDEGDSNQWLAANVAENSYGAQKEYQARLDQREVANRSKKLNTKIQRAVEKSTSLANYNSIAPRKVFSQDGILSVSPFMPIWYEGELFYVREVRRFLGFSYQGFWVNRPELETALMDEVSLDLGGASLQAGNLTQAGAANLVSLPWSLVAGELPELKILGLTPLRKTLIAGWVAAFLALVAISLLLAGVMKLSARRAAFVSSVTHELRTPLTTFRLYSEMLVDGMISSEEKKQSYLRTMLSESERLNHLVENVLSYAQIERGNAGSKFEKLQVVDLVERMRPVLQRRVDQEDAALTITLADDLGQLETDVTAVGQILFNLIDNACKYGLSPDGDSYVRLDVSRRGKGVAFVVSDQGRGIRRSEKKKLFRAFHKSAHEAAHDKPGVGLGLSLCRRLARALGGELKLASSSTKSAGASFELLLH